MINNKLCLPFNNEDSKNKQTKKDWQIITYIHTNTAMHQQIEIEDTGGSYLAVQMGAATYFILL